MDALTRRERDVVAPFALQWRRRAVIAVRVRNFRRARLLSFLQRMFQGKEGEREREREKGESSLLSLSLSSFATEIAFYQSISMCIYIECISSVLTLSTLHRKRRKKDEEKQS
jgi:hypothetical protein